MNNLRKIYRSFQRTYKIVEYEIYYWTHFYRHTWKSPEVVNIFVLIALSTKIYCHQHDRKFDATESARNFWSILAMLRKEEQYKPDWNKCI